MTQLPCGHEYCKSCVEELRQKGVDKSCPLCRKPLPPGPDQLFDLGHGIYMKIKGEVDRGRPTSERLNPWPALSDEQQGEMDQARAMLREAADQFIYSKDNKQGIADGTENRHTHSSQAQLRASRPRTKGGTQIFTPKAAQIFTPVGKKKNPAYQ